MSTAQLIVLILVLLIRWVVRSGYAPWILLGLFLAWVFE